MQEHHPYNMTPDQGWSQMSTILNETMPVERRSRRFILFWWTAAAVVTAALISVFALMNQPETTSHVQFSKPDTEASNSSVAEAPVLEPMITNPTVPQNSASNSTAGSNIQHKVEITNTSKPYKAQISNPSGPLSKSDKNIVSENLSVVAEITRESELNSQIETDIISNEISAVESTEEHTEMETTTQAENRNSSIVEFLPSISDVDLEFPAINASPLEGTLACCAPGKKLITPHLALGGILGVAQGLGVQGGVGVDINFTQRFSASVDLGYSTFNPDAAIFSGSNDLSFGGPNSILENDATQDGLGTYLPAEEVYNASAQDVSHFVRTIRQWQVGVGLKYDLTRKFFVEGGMALGFGRTSRSTYPIVTSDYFSDPLANNTKVSNSFDDFNVVRSWSASVHGGIGYRPSRHTEIYAQWTQDLQPYLIQNPTNFSSVSKRTDYIQGINIGLRYTL